MWVAASTSTMYRVCLRAAVAHAGGGRTRGRGRRLPVGSRVEPAALEQGVILERASDGADHELCPVDYGARPPQRCCFPTWQNCGFIPSRSEMRQLSTRSSTVQFGLRMT